MEVIRMNKKSEILQGGILKSRPINSHQGLRGFLAIK